MNGRVNTLEESLDELEELAPWNNKEEIKREVMSELAHYFLVSARVCSESAARDSKGGSVSDLATVLKAISGAMQKKSKEAVDPKGSGRYLLAVASVRAVFTRTVSRKSGR